MRKLILILILFLYIPHFLSAAEFRLDKGRIQVDYFGELIMHPGLLVELEADFLYFGKYRLFFGTGAGTYHHKWYHNAYFQNNSLGLRYQSNKAFFMDTEMNFAFFFTQPDGDIYTTEYHDEYPYYPVEPNLRYGVAFLFGWALPIEKMEFFFGPDIYFESQVNYAKIPHLALRVGASYQMGGKK